MATESRLTSGLLAVATSRAWSICDYHQQMYMEANLLVSPYIVLIVPRIAKGATDRDNGPLDFTLFDMLPASAERIVVDQGQGLASAGRVAGLEEIDISILDGGQVSTDDIALVLLSGDKRGIQGCEWESDRKG
jgi:hypothetical protein